MFVKRLKSPQSPEARPRSHWQSRTSYSAIEHTRVHAIKKSGIQETLPTMHCTQDECLWRARLDWLFRVRIFCVHPRAELHIAFKCCSYTPLHPPTLDQFHPRQSQGQTPPTEDRNISSARPKLLDIICFCLQHLSHDPSDCPNVGMLHTARANHQLIGPKMRVF